MDEVRSKEILKYCSMTQVLTKTVAHSTRPSFRPKTNNQPVKKNLGLQLSKSRQKLDAILENKVVSKLKFSNNVNKKTVPLKSYSSMKISFLEKLLLN